MTNITNTNPSHRSHDRAPTARERLLKAATEKDLYVVADQIEHALGTSREVIGVDTRRGRLDIPADMFQAVLAMLVGGGRIQRDIESAPEVHLAEDPDSDVIERHVERETARAISLATDPPEYDSKTGAEFDFPAEVIAFQNQDEWHYVADTQESLVQWLNDHEEIHVGTGQCEDCGGVSGFVIRLEETGDRMRFEHDGVEAALPVMTPRARCRECASLRSFRTLRQEDVVFDVSLPR